MRLQPGSLLVEPKKEAIQNYVESVEMSCHHDL